MNQATRTGSRAGMVRTMSGKDKPHASSMVLWRLVATRRTLEEPRKDGAAVWGESGQDSRRTDPRGISGVARPPFV